MTMNEKFQMFDVLLSTPEWAGNAKLPATANRKIVLLFCLVVDKEIKEKSELFKLFPEGVTAELETFISECLEKAGLQVLYEKLKALK